MQVDAMLEGGTVIGPENEFTPFKKKKKEKSHTKTQNDAMKYDHNVPESVAYPSGFQRFSNSSDCISGKT